MYILGINYLGQDTAVALVQDGNLICAAEEERLNREKHTREFPDLSIAFCLKKAGIDINDVDTIALSMNPYRRFTDKFLFHTLRYFPRANTLAAQEAGYARKLLGTEKELRNKTGFKNKISYLNHHFCHMASSYYLSPFSESAILSIDGLGEYESSVAGYASGNTIKKIYKKHYPHSLGVLYAAVTYFLGCRVNSGEGKIMGLAPYGNPDVYYKEFKKILKLKPNGNYELDLSYFVFPFKRDKWISDKFVNIFGPISPKDTEPTDRHRNIAAALQKVLEEGVLHVANELHKRVGVDNICLAGGVALNCVANGKILKKTPFKRIFVQPAASDAGAAIGAALYYYYAIAKKGKGQLHPHQKSTYLGPEFTESDYVSAINAYGLKYKKSDDISGESARLLSDGKILGWFQGAMEFGPRALGNRSIITAPYPAEMKDILNSRVKHRESYRPFAPSILREKCSEYFDSDHESPYMLLAYNTHLQKRESVAAIVHVDGTGRVQTVTEETNPRYYRLISEFEKLTGRPVILNTSFNVRGEPIVCEPEDAIKCFLKTKMDYLILGDYVIDKGETR